jgi:hypothetical protein
VRPPLVAGVVVNPLLVATSPEWVPKVEGLWLSDGKQELIIL